MSREQREENTYSFLGHRLVFVGPWHGEPLIYSTSGAKFPSFSKHFGDGVQTALLPPPPRHRKKPLPQRKVLPLLLQPHEIFPEICATLNHPTVWLSVGTGYACCAGGGVDATPGERSGGTGPQALHAPCVRGLKIAEEEQRHRDEEAFCAGSTDGSMAIAAAHGRAAAHRRFTVSGAYF